MTVSVDKAKLQSAPTIKKDLSDLSNPDYMVSIYQFFSLPVDVGGSESPGGVQRGQDSGSKTTETTELGNDSGRQRRLFNESVRVAVVRPSSPVLIQRVGLSLSEGICYARFMETMDQWWQAVESIPGRVRFQRFGGSGSAMTLLDSSRPSSRPNLRGWQGPCLALVSAVAGTRW